MGKWTRRALLTAGTLAGGGLLLGVGTVLFAPNRLGITPEPDPASGAIVTTWLRIHGDGRIVVLVPHCEMGQGAQLGAAMMLAEELDADWTQVSIEEAPAEAVYGNGYMLRTFLLAGGQVPSWLERAIDYTMYKLSDWGSLQITGGSASLRSTGVFGMRVAGATARQMLLKAAAARWQVPLEQLTVNASKVLHEATKRSASFGELASAAATIAPEMHLPLKARKDYAIVGRSQPRPDLPAKTDGSALYGIDVKLPDMLYAAIRIAPVPGAKLKSVDHAPAKAVPGVQSVVELADAVVVVAQSWWRAQQAVLALQPLFENDPAAAVVDTASLRAAHRAELAEFGKGSRKLKTGEGEGALAQAASTLDLEYEAPYLAHATMEPMGATAVFAHGKLELWSGTQDPLNARSVAAKALKLGMDEVVFHNMQVGGGYGRRLPFCFDYIDQAARIAAQVSPKPVKLIWSREQDMAHDYYRPMCLARMRGGLDAQGKALAWIAHTTGRAEMDSGLPPYRLPHREVRLSAAPAHLREGSWRSVDFSWHGFFNESFVDELAHLARIDPLQFRLDLLGDQPRHAAVLKRAAEMAGWGQPQPAGHGLGIAVVESFGTVCAQVALVEVAAGQVRVRRVWAAVDCGLVVNPDQALAQIEGGILFGLSAALLQEITVKDGAVVQRSFPDYPSLTLAQAPRIQVEFLESDAPLGGLGEPGVPPIAPAVANAIFTASGQRLRKLPLRLGEAQV